MTDFNPQLHMRHCIQKVATGPDYSKDLSFEEARDVMRVILNDDPDPVQTSILFIALRMKRETDEENRGMLQALIESSQQVVAEVELLPTDQRPHRHWKRFELIVAQIQHPKAAKMREP